MSDNPVEASDNDAISQAAVFAVREFVDTEVIDGGDTLVLRFKAPDDREVILLVPRRVIADLRTGLAAHESAQR